MPELKPLVVFIVGPTATGKSELALEAAKALGGEIINTDSIQVYAGLEIGSAKPPADYFTQVPHHLFSFVAEGKTCTAGDFRKAALEVIESKKTRAKNLFFAVGGSGFYVQALEKGMYPVPEIPASVKTQIEVDLRENGLPSLYQELRSLDPKYASEISENDTYRIMRALEINRHLQTSGAHEGETTWSGIRRVFESKQIQTRPFDVLKIGVMRPRDEIRKSVESRTRKMLASGLIDEVKQLQSKGLSKWAPLLSVGYREVQMHLEGEMSANDLPQAITTSTMQLVKRQTTWFRKDSSIKWFDPKDGWAEPMAFIAQAIKARQS